MNLLKIGDLVYIPSQVTLLQFNERFNENTEHFNPSETYIGPSPMKIHQLKKPINLLLMEVELLDEKYVKVWYDGGEWYVDRKDINNI